MSLFSRILQWLRPRRTKSEELARRMAAIRTAVAAPATPQSSTADMLKSAIRKGFNSTQPVTSSSHLHGRQDQLELLCEGVLDRGNHALIYGARGSGKTSLARVFANMADERGLVVLYSACEPNQDFGALIKPYVDAMAGTRIEWPADRPVNPRDVIEQIAPRTRRRFVLILDEFDRITDRPAQHDVARLMKMLSDAAIPVHIIAVGIAAGVDALIAGHASLRRHMSVIPISRIESQAVFDIIARGAASVGMSFTDASRETIAHLACGSPYHVRLFCALACFEVIKRKERKVGLPATLAGVSRAVNDWALTNAEDAALFRKVITTNSPHWNIIETIVRTTAAQGFMTRAARNDERGDCILFQLKNALIIDAENDRITFQDSLAPQFFLAMLFAAQNREKIDENIISMNDFHRQIAAE